MNRELNPSFTDENKKRIGHGQNKTVLFLSITCTYCIKGYLQCKAKPHISLWSNSIFFYIQFIFVHGHNLKFETNHWCASNALLRRVKFILHHICFATPSQFLLHLIFYNVAFIFEILFIFLIWVNNIIMSANNVLLKT